MRYFTPSPRTATQLLRDLCMHVGFPVPTRLEIEASREDVRDEIIRAKNDGDVDRAKLLETENADLLNEDREQVLTDEIARLKELAEEGDRAAAEQARHYRDELAELRRNKVDDDIVGESESTEDDDHEEVKS